MKRLMPEGIEPQYKKNSGFTLIELMIVVVIIGILASIAYPSYLGHMQKTRRSDAQIALTEIANRQEKFNGICSAYSPTGNSGLTDAWPVGACTPLTTNVGINYATASPEGHYTLSLDTTTPVGGYTITATANNPGQQANDTPCLTITLDSAGAKAPSNCWN